MSHVRRKIFRGKVNDLLSRADDEAFFVMVWATHAIQSGRADKARSIFSFPREAITSELTSKYAVHPWKMETMLNELLTVPKLKLQANRPNRRLDCRKFAAIAKLTNHLKDLENAEDGLALRRVNVLREMHRLGQRQFEWQRGFLSYPQLYRSAFIYGGALTKSFFAEANPFSMDQFTIACFALRAMFLEKPIVRLGGMDQIGISETTLYSILDLISIRHAAARTRATELRARGGHTGYKRSLFRLFPCVAFGQVGERIHAPLPDLVTLRATSGLFYDVTKAGGSVRNEISRRFEIYCLELLGSMLPARRIEGSYKYPLRRNEIDTPDILLYEGDEISIVFECKATRMSYEARYSEDPITEAARGYEEIAKGIFQIWRFASHHRRGMLGEQRMRSDLKGVILTLDTWLTMANAMQADVLNLARTIAAKSDQEITEADQIPICFCSIEDLEQTLSTATDESFFLTIRKAAEERYQGWQLWGVHQEVAPHVNQHTEYPFANRMSEVLPWWDSFGVGDER